MSPELAAGDSRPPAQSSPRRIGATAALDREQIVRPADQIEAFERRCFRCIRCLKHLLGVLDYPTYSWPMLYPLSLLSAHYLDMAWFSAPTGEAF